MGEEGAGAVFSTLSSDYQRWNSDPHFGRNGNIVMRKCEYKFSVAAAGQVEQQVDSSVCECIRKKAPSCYSCFEEMPLHSRLK